MFSHSYLASYLIRPGTTVKFHQKYFNIQLQTLLYLAHVRKYKTNSKLPPPPPKKKLYRFASEVLIERLTSSILINNFDLKSKIRDNLQNLRVKCNNLLAAIHLFHPSQMTSRSVFVTLLTHKQQSNSVFTKIRYMFRPIRPS